MNISLNSRQHAENLYLSLTLDLGFESLKPWRISLLRGVERISLVGVSCIFLKFLFVKITVDPKGQKRVIKLKVLLLIGKTKRMLDRTY